ncbi:hypothetical protein SCUCBS95973_009353 [Sporothrix curviconia]|uniref:Glutathione S-transferase n=1 Tax=Sporothrix curviconia TaxID=1260050 RepID=A0ABP0CU79_9PEZI
MPGPVYHPVATGIASDTVTQHAGPASIVLWGGWFCPFTQRTWAALEAKGIPYQYREVNPYLKEKDFIDISPHGLTPGLQVDGRPLHDSTVINEFLEEAGSALGAHPAVPSLWPNSGDGPYEKARARLWIDHVNKAAVPAFIRLLQAASPPSQAAALAAWTTALDHITAHCQGPFFFGNEISLVDLAIAPWAVRDFILCEKRGFRRDQVSGWTAWAEALERHPAVQRTTSNRDKYLEFNQTFMRNEDHSAVAKAARAGEQII